MEMCSVDMSTLIYFTLYFALIYFTATLSNKMNMDMGSLICSTVQYVRACSPSKLLSNIKYLKERSFQYSTFLKPMVSDFTVIKCAWN